MSRRIMISIILVTVFICSLIIFKNTLIEKNKSANHLQDLYPGKISKVDHIEIRNGRTGELKSYTDKRQIQEWVNSVRKIKLKSDSNQDKRVGFIFFVDLYEGRERKLRFTPSEIAENHFTYNNELENQIRALFESKNE